MTGRTVARRYAKGLLAALMDVCPDQDQTIADQLDSLADVVRQHSGLELLIVNPAIRADQKAAIIDQIATRLQFHEILRRFLALLAEKERLEHVGAIAALFRQFLDEQKGVITAEITTPTELGAGAEADLRDRLQTATGRPVRIETRADPALLGGMVTRIGDIVYDGSLRSHLERIRRELSTV